VKTAKKITFHRAPYKSTTFENKQDRRCDFSVTFWRLRITIVAIEMQQYLLFLLLLEYI